MYGENPVVRHSMSLTAHFLVQVIENVNRDIKALDAQLNPRKKFQFSNKAKKTTTAPGSDGPNDAEPNTDPDHLT
jgi:P2-related tail formation protein